MKFEVFSDMPEKEGKKTIELPKDRKKGRRIGVGIFFS